MMTGLYPGGHGVHENARHLADTHPVVAARLKDAGYRTAAFVSSFILARRFGLARGFDVYDDTLPAGQVERTSRATTDQALAYLGQASSQPLFLWVHYFDPHTPYAPAPAFRRGAREGALPRRDRGDGRAARPSRPGVRRLRRSSRHTLRNRRHRAITARASATTASCSTATSSISRRCTCRW